MKSETVVVLHFQFQFAGEHHTTPFHGSEATRSCGEVQDVCFGSLSSSPSV